VKHSLEVLCCAVAVLSRVLPYAVADAASKGL
jgi:hypothetical protein